MAGNATNVVIGTEKSNHTAKNAQTMIEFLLGITIGILASIFFKRIITPIIYKDAYSKAVSEGIKKVVEDTN